MKKKNNRFKKAIATIISVAVISSCGMVVCADDTVYYTNDKTAASMTYFYTDSYISVSGSNLVPNIDSSEKLSFSISNVYGSSLMFVVSPSEGAIEQRLQDNSWGNVSGSHGSDPEYDDMTPADVFSKLQLFPAYSTYSYDMDVSFLDAGEYRLKLYMLSEYGEYIEDYVYFSVSENVSASAENVVYTSSPTIDVEITNNLPVDISSDLSKNLKILEYTDGAWEESDIKLTNTSKKSTIKSGKTSTLTLSFKDIDSSDVGKYRITAKFDAEKSTTGESYPESKTVSVDFTLKDPADIEILSATVSARDDLYVALKIKNNTDEAMTVGNIGKIAKEANNHWINVSYKNNAKSFDTSYTINPGEEKTVKIYLSDYYRITRLSIGLVYRVNIDVNGKTYYRYFKLSKGTIQSESNNSDSDETYYIIDETEI